MLQDAANRFSRILSYYTFIIAHFDKCTVKNIFLFHFKIIETLISNLTKVFINHSCRTFIWRALRSPLNQVWFSHIQSPTINKTLVIIYNLSSFLLSYLPQNRATPNQLMGNQVIIAQWLARWLATGEVLGSNPGKGKNLLISE